MKKIMMLGAGACQLNAIKRIKALGYQVLVSDNRLDSPGKVHADVKVLADTFSFKETYRESKKHAIDGIMTSGTDQPVLVVNRVAERLDLPNFLGGDIALNVTNKRYMKEILSEHNIPTTKYYVSHADFKDVDLDHLNPPYVIKPVDSQGQRGIYKVDQIADIRSLFDDVLSHSRETYLLIEEYYENKEITVSGWVDEGVCHILTVTDRVTFDSDEHIGVCVSHEYPSIHLNRYREEIFQITHDICRGFKIKEGPIYFQYLVGDDGVLVNEIACRIGGAYEDITIPLITGVDLLKMNIEGTLNKTYDKRALRSLLYREDTMCTSTQLFFCSAGEVTYITPREQLLALDCVVDMAYNFKIGDDIPEIENASQRAGYVIITGEDEDSIKENIKKVFDLMVMQNADGINLVKPGKRWYRA